MAELALNPLAVFIDDLLAALSRLFTSWAEKGRDTAEIKREADRMVFLILDAANVTADVRREFEDILSDGAPGHVLAVCLRQRLERLENQLAEQRHWQAQLAGVPGLGLERVCEAIDRLHAEYIAYRDLTAAALAAATATPGPDFWERAQASNEGPFTDEAQLISEFRGKGLL